MVGCDTKDCQEVLISGRASRGSKLLIFLTSFLYSFFVVGDVG